MKHLLIAIVFMLAFSFCKNGATKNADFKDKLAETNSVFRLSEHYSKFRFHDLTEFKIDKFLGDEYSEKQYRKLDSAIAFTIFQQDDSLSPYDIHLYYSTFSDSTLISILENSEANGWAIWLCKFNKNGKFIDKEIIANHLVDGGEDWRSRGQSVGNNTFIHTEIDSWDLHDEDGKIDSTIVKIEFKENNTIKIDTIFKNQEIIKNKKE